MYIEVARSTTILHGQLRPLQNQDGEDAPVSIRFDPEVKAILDQHTAEQERSIGWVVNKALRAHFGIDKPKVKPKS